MTLLKYSIITVSEVWVYNRNRLLHYQKKVFNLLNKRIVASRQNSKNILCGLFHRRFALKN